MTEANFPTPVLTFTLTYEGGKADNPKDPGGRTNQGITQKTYTAWLAKNGQPTRDVFHLTDTERDGIYRTGFWNAVGGATLPPGVDLACFDFAVNSGPARALAALRRAGGAEAAAKDPAAAVKAICAARLSFLRALGTFATFGRGWSARVAACEALGVKLALHGGAGRPAGEAPGASAAPALAREAQAAGAAAIRHRTAAQATAAAAATFAVPTLCTAGHPALTAILAASCAGLAGLAAVLAGHGRHKATLAAAYAAQAA